MDIASFSRGLLQVFQKRGYTSSITSLSKKPGVRMVSLTTRSSRLRMSARAAPNCKSVSANPAMRPRKSLKRRKERS